MTFRDSERGLGPETFVLSFLRSPIPLSAKGLTTLKRVGRGKIYYLRPLSDLPTEHNQSLFRSYPRKEWVSLLSGDPLSANKGVNRRILVTFVHGR